ncbi:MAG: arylesterase, partial [Rhizobiales bacterium]|nr:arylesterase [Hyphomicrobiales bacterium]
LGPDYAKRFDGLYPDLAAKHGAMLYPFFLDGVAAEQTLLQADGMHPNAAGVAVIVEKILPAVEDLVAQARR